MHSIKVSPVFLSAIFLLLSPLITAEYLKNVINELQGNVSLKPGDVLQCEIMKTDLDGTKNDYHVLTQACSKDADQCYVYQEVSEKCFSFKLKASKISHIIFGNTPFVSPGNVEIILEWDNKSYIWERAPNNSQYYVKRVDTSDVLTDREYRGFWVRWIDDELLEIGRENETVPFLQHRFPRKLQISYVGILSWSVPGAWIIHKDPKCPSIAGSNGAEASKKLLFESECMVLM